MGQWETMRQLQFEKAIMAVNETVKYFSESSKNQINLSAEAARLALSKCIVEALIERGLLPLKRKGQKRHE